MSRPTGYAKSLLAAPVFLFSTVVNAATYHVDARDGDDRGNGQSADEAWRTIDRVNRHAFGAGDTVLFRRGQTWSDATVRVATPDLTLGAYGDGARPRLIGAIRIERPERSADGRVRITLPNRSPVRLLAAGGTDFYTTKVGTTPATLTPGTFHHDRGTGLLVIAPRGGPDEGPDWYLVGTRDQIVELANSEGASVTVRDLELSYSNRFGLGPWWQGGYVQYGPVSVQDCLFHGNASSAVALSGAARYPTVTLERNQVESNGAEGIYIGISAVSERLLIADNRIGSHEDRSFGWASEGPTSAYNGDGIDIKWGNTGVEVLRNQVVRVRGLHGIATQSSGSLVAGNRIEGVYMLEGALQSGITIDVQGPHGPPVVVRDNHVSGARSHGIVLRGDVRTRPPVVVEENRIQLSPDSGYAQFHFQSANNSNIVLRRNDGAGGTYGIWLAGLPPDGLVVIENHFGSVPTVFRSDQAQISGMRAAGNTACAGAAALLRLPNDPPVRDALSADLRLGSNGVALVECPATDVRRAAP